MTFKRCTLSVALLALTLGATEIAAQTVPIVGGTPAVQPFDSLASSGTTGSAMPNGWYFVETGNNANTTYGVDDGTSNSGNTFSYGSTGSTDRALGMLRSSSLVPTIGAQLRNESGQALSEIGVNYTGEQWRLGVTGRADSLQFQYSLNATSIVDTAATWTTVAALNFASPTTTGAAGKLDGNAAANRTAISGTISGLNLPVNATIWVRWNDIDIAGADDGLAIDDVSFAVAGGPPVDLPPSVVSTSPLNAAINVALNSTLSVNFSEAVTLGNPWFTLTCASSGAHTATVSGGPSNYTLTPSPAFSANETCTWTILASGVSDQDATPDPLAADTVISFTTLDPSNLPPPTLVSSIPANNAINVPKASDVRLTFSEAVTTSANAFALSCNSAPLVLTETGSGATRTLTPATLLPAGAICVFTVTGALVRNTADIAVVGNPTISFTVTDGSSSTYYSQVNASSSPQLRCSLHNTIKGHTVFPYSGSGTSTWTILEIAQEDPNNPNKIIDVYRNRSYNRGSERAGTGSGITYNREHTWPNSIGFSTNTLAAYTDTHMLWLSDTDQNSSRGNKPYGNCSSSCTELPSEANNGVGGGTGLYPGNSNWVRTPDGNAGTFETWNHRKGEMARAMFYMAIRYEGIAAEDAHDGNIPDLELTDTRSLIGVTSNTAAKAYMGLLTDLLAWHQADPPDAEEIARNDLIQTFQGNRNPFVDHPEWATRALFESVNPAVCEPPPSNDVIFANGFDSVTP